MGLQKNDQMDLGFEVVPGGKYRWQITDGLDKFDNTTKGTSSLKIVLESTKALKGRDGRDEDGAEAGVGKKATLFVHVQTPYGEKVLSTILTATGIIDKVIEVYGDNPDYLSDKFIAMLKAKLNGKIIDARHEIRQDQKGKDQVNFMWIGPQGAIEGQKGAASAPKPTPSAKVEDETEAGTDSW